MYIQSLTGKWQFREAETSEWLPAQVPGSVHTDLLALGRILDPFADNELRVQWVTERDWEYKLSFAVTPGSQDVQPTDVAQSIWSEPTDPGFEQEVERNYRYNATVNVLDGTFYWLGASFIAPSTILPLYVSHFTDNRLVIGLLSMITSAGWLLPQLFTANWIQRLPRKKVAPVHVGLFTERLPVLLMVPAVWLATRSHTTALVVFLVLFTWYVCGAGVVAVGWQDMLAKVIPLERRGRFLGITHFGGSATCASGGSSIPPARPGLSCRTRSQRRASS